YEKPWQVYNTSNEAPEGAPEFALNKAGELRKYFGVPKKGTIPRDKGDTLLHGYYACISYMDAQVGKLLTALEEKGLKDNTIVVLFGDHGFKLGDFNDWCKDTHYELDTRVPLILHHPDKPAGRTSSITELIDLYPTLIEAAGVKKNSQSLSGTDLTPLFDKTNQKLKKAAFSQRPRKKVVGFSVRTENYRLVKWISKTNRDSTVAMELYDYTKSPIELKNVADDDDYLHIQEELSAMLADEIGI
ncbi:MAG: sulfatase-like hydrolase/transferase, partial [Cyclobacteriaceae bacterium]|nr:sulfatase-like hydrolase/transferase [Cyclobacteriaceae bacterium HetDA_MAG_MS6]